MWDRREPRSTPGVGRTFPLPGQDGFEVGGRFVDQSTSARRAIERHAGG